MGRIAAEHVLIDVTHIDIHHGHARRRDACPIALAISRVVDATIVQIQHDHVQFNGSIWYRDGVAMLPIAAKQFVRRVDLGWTVEPISFSLDLVPLPKGAVR